MNGNNLIILEKLEGNAPAGQLGVIQSLLAPWLNELQFAFYCLWFGTLAYMIIRHLIPAFFNSSKQGIQKQD